MVLTKDDSIQLKGIAAVLIFLHHLSLNFQTGTIVDQLRSIGFVVTGMFFFLSGYGLMVSYVSKRDGDLKLFLTKRFKAVILPYLVAAVVYYIYKQFFVTFTVKSVFDGLITGTLVDYSWYVIEICILYLLFGIIFYGIKSLSDRAKLIIMFISCLLLFVIFWAAGSNECWYSSMLVFVAGLVAGNNIANIMATGEETTVEEGQSDEVSIVVVLATLLTGALMYVASVLFWRGFEYGGIRALGVAILANLTGALLCWSACNAWSRLKIHNRGLMLIGRWSYSIYLYQGIVLGLIVRFR